MDAALFDLIAKHSPEFLPAFAILYMLYRITRCISSTLPQIFEKVTQIRELHEKALHELKALRNEHNQLDERVTYIESNCGSCSPRRTNGQRINFDG